MFNIKEFKGYLAETGYVPTSRYIVDIPMPAGLYRALITSKGVTGEINNVNAMPEHLRFRAEKIDLPGVNVVVTPTDRYGIGPAQRFASDANLVDINAEFLVDKDQLISMFFYHWMNNIFSFNRVRPTDVPEDNNYYNYRASYLVDYAVDIRVYVYDYSGGNEAKTTFTLFDAFPVAIEPIGLSWNEENRLIKIRVKFSYRDWTIDETTTTDGSIAPLGPKPLNIGEPGDAQRVIYDAITGIFRSDARLKKNISQLHTTDNGIKLYKFEYLWSDTPYVGVMAQDILKTVPKAVHTTSDGYYAVNYDMLGLKMSTYEDWAKQSL